jgi:hypothetical protein
MRRFSEERTFKYGEDASPSKPLELGVVILRRFVPRLSDFSIAEQTAIAKQFDASSLVEVTSIAGLPSDLKLHFKGWLGQRRENLARHPKMMIPVIYLVDLSLRVLAIRVRW